MLGVSTGFPVHALETLG